VSWTEVAVKGLDWIKVSTNIGVDGDLEYLSDAAFRTYIELLAASSALLNDGRVCRRDARKRCNTRRLSVALDELSASGHVILDDDFIVLPKYAKWQLTRAEVEESRAKTRERVTAYRQRNKPVTNSECTENVREQSKSKSKSKSKSISPPIVPPYGEDFTKFWNLYPRKQAKARAEKAWAKWAKAKVSPSVILDTLKAQLPELKKREREYIPLAATWLNSEPWRDELEKSAEKQDESSGLPEIVVPPEFWREDW
jgi:hypothetical protein